MDGKDRVAKLLELVEKMSAEASKAKLIEVVQVLALEVAHYRQRCGTLRADEAIAMLDMNSLTEEQMKWVIDALEGAAATLAAIPDLAPSVETRH